jgi:hypothetical protein
MSKDILQITEKCLKAVHCTFQTRKESADPRLRPGLQGRDVKGGQGNYSSRELSNSNGMLAAFCKTLRGLLEVYVLVMLIQPLF